MDTKATKTICEATTTCATLPPDHSESKTKIRLCTRLASKAPLFAIDKPSHIRWTAWLLGSDPKILDMFARS